MEYVRFVNGRGESLTFKGSPPFIYLGLNGYSNQTARHTTVEIIDADGVVYSGTTLESSKKELRILTKANDLEEMYDCRRQLARLFNPKAGVGKLYLYRDGESYVYCNVVVDEIPDFTRKRATQSREDTIILEALEPFWMTAKQSIEFSTVEGGLHWDMAIPADGVDFGYRVIDVIKEIENAGDEPTGATFKLTALGPVLNPTISNLTTEDQLRLNYSMETGETITISTVYDSHSIWSSVNGDIIDDFDITSDWLQIDSGTCEYRIGASSGVDSLTLTVSYTPLLLGV